MSTGDTPSTALPEIRVEEIRARLARAARAAMVAQDQQVVAFHLHAPDDVDFLLADRDRLQRRVEELEATRERVHRVHLDRHTRLAVALGMDPGYSADATINEAIERLAAPTSETPHAK